MSIAYTTYWAQDVCAAAKPNAVARLPLRVLYGGPHQSEPSFLRMKVTVGDLIYPITVRRKTLLVLGRLRVAATQGALTCEQLADYHQRHPEWSFLAPTCTDEAILGEESTTIDFGRPLPSDMLRRLTFRSQKAVRTLNHIDDDGHLTRAVGVQGIFRLTDESAADLATLFSSGA